MASWTPGDDVAAVIARLEHEERELVLPAFTHDDAWRLGCLLVELAEERSLAVTIDIRKGTQQVFHAALEGTTPDNDSWVERKVRTVYRFGASSYLVGRRHAAGGNDFNEATGLPFQEYVAHGGAFPIRVEGVGIVGVATVSGLPQAEDHALVVEGLRALAS
ncbi:heme-degrading domain-containing protein [Xylanimonas sp. McL0601]|uniref:heme-degrading domain-containing protein n=1 Tax=Xylanimonas sp. McL0601 TaxID=3414739 RepID=UPI003CF27BEC